MDKMQTVFDAQPLGGLEIMGMAENAIRHAMKLLEEAREVLDAELKHVGATPVPYAPGRDWAGRPTPPVLYRRVRESELEDSGTPPELRR